MTSTSPAGEAYEGTEIDFRSDYGAFFDAGIPFGGLFSGRRGPQDARAGRGLRRHRRRPFDPCYHAECDTYDNVSLHALATNADSVANATITYAKAHTLPGPAEAAADARAAAAAAPAAADDGPPRHGLAQHAFPAPFPAPRRRST